MVSFGIPSSSIYYVPSVFVLFFKFISVQSQTKSQRRKMYLGIEIGHLIVAIKIISGKFTKASTFFIISYFIIRIQDSSKPFSLP